MAKVYPFGRDKYPNVDVVCALTNKRSETLLLFSLLIYLNIFIFGENHRNTLENMLEKIEQQRSTTNNTAVARIVAKLRIFPA